jgi:RNA polymerase sigma factor (sigma-70 family)
MQPIPSLRPSPTLPELLECHQRELQRIVSSAGRDLLRHEAAEDLQQEINLHVLQVADRFVYRSKREFLGWLAQVARQRIATRLRAFGTRQRNLGLVHRSTFLRTRLHSVANGLLAPEPEPAALADRKEQIALLQQVLRAQLPRDQDLLVWMAAGMPVEETARRLGLSRESTNRARQRAVDRLRAAFMDSFEAAVD